MLNITYRNFTLVYFLLPYFTYRIAKTLVKTCMSENQNRCLRFSGSTLEILLYIQLLSIVMKFDHIIQLRWKEVFGLYWIIFSVTVAIAFAISMVLLTKLCNFLCDEADASDRMNMADILNPLTLYTLLF